MFVGGVMLQADLLWRLQLEKGTAQRHEIKQNGCALVEYSERGACYCL